MPNQQITFTYKKSHQAIALAFSCNELFPNWDLTKYQIFKAGNCTRDAVLSLQNVCIILHLYNIPKKIKLGQALKLKKFESLY